MSALQRNTFKTYVVKLKIRPSSRCLTVYSCPPSIPLVVKKRFNFIILMVISIL